MFDRVVRVINHDGVLQESLDAPTGSGSCSLTCTLGFLQPMHTFLTLVQTCTVCCALGRTSNIDDACGYLRLGLRKMCWASSRNRRSERVRDETFCTAACSFVPFLLPSIGVMRFDILEADVCIVYRRERHSRKEDMVGIEVAADVDGETLGPSNKRPVINEVSKETQTLHSLLTP